MAMFVGGAFAIRLVSSRSVLKQLSRQRAQKAAFSANYAYLDLKADLERQAIDHLDHDLQNGQIDFYILKKNEKDIAFGSPLGNRPKLRYESEISDELFIFDDMAYANVRAGPYTATVGVILQPFDLVYREIKDEWRPYFVASCLITLLAIILATRYFLSDIQRAVGQIARRGYRSFDHRQAKSYEAELLARGLAGYEAQSRELNARNRTLSQQVLSGPRHELESGKAPPYRFNCTLVRTDINNFSSLFSSARHGEAFLNDVNTFFHELTGIVSRYGGYIYEFIGDEAIYYFKDEDCGGMSAAFALSSVRDIHDAATKLCEATSSERGYDFYVKSSAAYGELMFARQVRNFSLAGTPLIETVRILGLISEKRENKIYFGTEVATRAQPLFMSSSVGSFALKGLEGERQLFQSVSGLGLQDALSAEAPESWAIATCFRSDQNVAEILGYLHANWKALPHAKLMTMLSLFRQYSFENANSNIIDGYLKFAHDLLDRQRNGDDQAAQPLSALLLAARGLVPKSAYDDRLRFAFKSALQSTHLRVVANALEAFAWFEPASEEVLFSHLEGHSNNRVRANLLMKRAIGLGFERKVAREFKRMIESKNPYYQASGLWALGETAAHFRETDPVYFSSETRLQSCLDLAVKRVGDANEMVARQANALIEKSGRAENPAIAA